MKLSFSTVMCMEYDAAQLIGMCDKYGFDGVEVRMNDDGSFVNGRGLYITDLGSSLCFKKYNEEQLCQGKRILKIAEENNIKGVRVFLGNFRQRYDAAADSIEHEGIVKMLKELCAGTTKEVWVETHNEYSTGKILKGLIEDVNRENLKIIWDIMHPIEDGEAPDDTMRYLGERIAHVHIKDGKKRTDPVWHDYEYTPIGEGSLPIAETIGILKKCKYEGFLSLEWESLWRQELKKLDMPVDEVLNSYVKFMDNFNTAQ